MAEHKITFVISAVVDLDGVDETPKIEALVNIFRSHAQQLEGQLDLLDIKHEVKAELYSPEQQSVSIGFK